jgi:hypothetical protein
MSQYIQNLSQKRPDLIPSDFNYTIYLNLNPDLKQQGILTEENAIRHYILHGKKEHRFYKYAKLHDGPVDAGFGFSDKLINSHGINIDGIKITDNLNKAYSIIHQYNRKESFNNKVIQYFST